ncbi:hypothetical protein N7540_003959 [Penicillium herquei]|nr:hypothetical protein N7540_003959 [Penicillium herquei]
MLIMGNENPERHIAASGIQQDDSSSQNDTKGKGSRLANEDPFGSEEVAEVKYRTMKWWYVLVLVLLKRAAILIVFLGVLSWYTGFIIGQFKLRYPHVHSMGDAGEMLFGPVGRVLLEIGQLLLLVFVMSSHILTATIVFSTLTDKAVCGIVFGVVALVICFLGSLPRTMARVYWLSVISFASIFITTIVTMISIGVQSKSDIKFEVVRQVSFYEGFLAFTNIMFGFIAHVTFFGLISETQDPEFFPRSLAMLQITDTVLYLVAGLVIYRYAGADVQSPSPSSAGPLMKKICYGLAIPTVSSQLVFIAGIVVGHVACKYVYVRILRGSSHMHRNSFVGIGTWAGIGGLLWIVAWVIAESIPGFNDLLSLISALFGSIFSFALPAIFWLYMNKGKCFSTVSKTCLTIVNLLILAIGCFMCGAGLYVSGRALSETASQSSWSCKVST